MCQFHASYPRPATQYSQELDVQQLFQSTCTKDGSQSYGAVLLTPEAVRVFYCKAEMRLA